VLVLAPGLELLTNHCRSPERLQAQARRRLPDTFARLRDVQI